jgi:GTP-binding protein
MANPIVAIVGRPNVGKSNLFNRLLQKRIAIVEDEPGVTRDRLYGRMDWSGREFVLIDTGGIEFTTKGGPMGGQVRQQAEMAIAESDVILFVVDGQEGLTSGDKEVAELLRRSNKPVILVVNKIDHPNLQSGVWEFHALGLAKVIPVSAQHGLNTGDLLDEINTLLPKDVEVEETGEVVIKIAVIGKPNAGKSSLVNTLLGEERVIVSDQPGTTRDAIDTLLQRDRQQYLLIDTAGLRRTARIEVPTERFSVLRALRAIERSDVVLMVIDATQGITEQDKRVAGYAHERGRGLILVINKWDLIKKDGKTAQEYQKEIRYQLSFLDYAPIIFVSALTGQRCGRILNLVNSVAVNQQLRIPTAELNRLLLEATQIKPPPSRKGKQGKFYYTAQTGVGPPSFIFFVNDPKLIHFSYMRYLENKLREAFDFTGTPIRINLRRRS